MALDKLKQELIEKAAQKARAETEKQRAEAEKEQARRNFKNSQRPALLCLQQLENFFWECANDFSRLANLKIDYTNRPKTSWWSLRPIGSSATLDDPRLEVGFKADSWEYNKIKLELSDHSNNTLFFTAEYYYMGHYAAGTGGIPGKTYVHFSKNLSVKSFEVQVACRWLESNFEEYYRRLLEFKANKKC